MVVGAAVVVVGAAVVVVVGATHVVVVGQVECVQEYFDPVLPTALPGVHPPPPQPATPPKLLAS